MKRIQIIIPVLLGAFCTGCDLDIEPQDRYDQQTFWYSAKAAEGGLTGCYNALLENGIYGRAAVYWEDDATPNGYNFSNDDSWTTIANGAQTATSGGIIANRWSHAYKGIGRCNTLLDNNDLIFDYAPAVFHVQDRHWNDIEVRCHRCTERTAVSTCQRKHTDNHRIRTVSKYEWSTDTYGDNGDRRKRISHNHGKEYHTNRKDDNTKVDISLRDHIFHDTSNDFTNTCCCENSTQRPKELRKHTQRTHHRKEPLGTFQKYLRLVVRGISSQDQHGNNNTNRNAYHRADIRKQRE